MAAVIVPFNPSSTELFQFQPTLDGVSYLVVITWSLYSQRFYFNIYTLQNQRVLTLPLIGSPPDDDISLTAGYFDTKVIYRPSMRQFEIV